MNFYIKLVLCYCYLVCTGWKDLLEYGIYLHQLDICVLTWQEIIQEQITRVLLERLIVNRPHPWGLLITFIELIKVFFCSYKFFL